MKKKELVQQVIRQEQMLEMLFHVILNQQELSSPDMVTDHHQENRISALQRELQSKDYAEAFLQKNEPGTKRLEQKIKKLKKENKKLESTVGGYKRDREELVRALKQETRERKRLESNLRKMKKADKKRKKSQSIKQQKKLESCLRDYQLFALKSRYGSTIPIDKLGKVIDVDFREVFNE